MFRNECAAKSAISVMMCHNDGSSPGVTGV